jgi:hypothetical protein
LHKVELVVDASDFAAAAQDLGAAVDQLPYIFSRTLNDAAFITRKVIVEDVWPRSIKMRNSTFLTAALRVELATKSDLRVEIADRLHRAHLRAHARGGSKQGRSLLAVPTKRVRRGARGAVVPSDKPRNLKRAVRRGNLIFQAISSGKHDAKGRLQLMYVLTPSVSIPKDVPFFETFYEVMVDQVAAQLPANVALAMRTRRMR